MAWEERNGKLYYYRKERAGSRVRSVYVAKSETALLISQLEMMRRDEAREKRDYEKELRALDERADRTLDHLSELTDLLTVAALLTSGYHTHKRQWRRKR